MTLLDGIVQFGATAHSPSLEFPANRHPQCCQLGRPPNTSLESSARWAADDCMAQTGNAALAARGRTAGLTITNLITSTVTITLSISSPITITIYSTITNTITIL